MDNIFGVLYQVCISELIYKLFRDVEALINNLYTTFIAEKHLVPGTYYTVFSNQTELLIDFLPLNASKDPEADNQTKKKARLRGTQSKYLIPKSPIKRVH